MSVWLFLAYSVWLLSGFPTGFPSYSFAPLFLLLTIPISHFISVSLAAVFS